MKKIKFDWKFEDYIWIDDIICKSFDIEIYKLDEDYIIRIIKGRKYARLNSCYFGKYRGYEEPFYYDVNKLNIIKKDGLNFKEITKKDLPKWYLQNKEEADKISSKNKYESNT